MTYTSKTTQKTNDTHTPREVSPAGFTLLTEADIEMNGLINCAPQRARLAQLHNSAAMLGPDGPSDQLSKLNTALITAIKGLEIIEGINKKRGEAAHQKGISNVKDGITDAEFNADIQALCDLLEKVPAHAYKPGTKYGPPVSDVTAYAPESEGDGAISPKQEG